jgi:hypothetical protein
MLDSATAPGKIVAMKRRGFLKATLAACALLSAAAAAARGAVADLCSKLTPKPRAIKLPPIPKWNKATDDIDGADFVHRSAEFERSLLPRDLLFPRGGETWEAVRDCEVHGFFQTGPKGAGFCPKVRLQKGERIRVLPLDHPKPLLVRFQRLTPDHATDQCFMRMARTVPGQVEAEGYFNELFKLVEKAA